MNTVVCLTSCKIIALFGVWFVLIYFLWIYFFLFALDGFPKYLEIPNCMLCYKAKWRHIKNFKSLRNNGCELGRASEHS